MVLIRSGRLAFVSCLIVWLCVLLTTSAGAFRFQFPSSSHHPGVDRIPRTSQCQNVTESPDSSWWQFPLRFNPQIEYQSEYWYNLWNVWARSSADPPHSRRRHHFGIQLALYRSDNTWQCSDLSQSSWMYQIAVSDNTHQTFNSYELVVPQEEMTTVSTGSQPWHMVGPYGNWYQIDANKFREFRYEFSTGLTGTDQYGVNVTVEMLEPGCVPVQHDGYFGMNGTGMIVMEQVWLRIRSGRIVVSGQEYILEEGEENESVGMLGRAMRTTQPGTTWDSWDWNFLQITDDEHNHDRGAGVYIAQIRPRDQSGQYLPMSQGLNVITPPTTPGGEWTNEFVSGFTNDRFGPWTSPVTNVTYLLDSRLIIPAIGLDAILTPFQHDNELSNDGKPIFYEGAMHFQGMMEQRPVKGFGYTEMTGYPRP